MLFDTLKVSPLTGDETLSYGHIENDRYPGQRQMRFTLEDLKNEKVYYVLDDRGGFNQVSFDQGYKLSLFSAQLQSFWVSLYNRPGFRPYN